MSRMQLSKLLLIADVPAVRHVSVLSLMDVVMVLAVVVSGPEFRSVIAFVVAEVLFTADVFSTTAVFIMSVFVIVPAVFIVGVVWGVVVSAVVVAIVSTGRTSVTATVVPTGAVSFTMIVFSVMLTVIGIAAGSGADAVVC